MIRRRSSCGFVDDEGTSDDQANQHCPGDQGNRGSEMYIR